MPGSVSDAANLVVSNPVPDSMTAISDSASFDIRRQRGRCYSRVKEGHYRRAGANEPTLSDHREGATG